MKSEITELVLFGQFVLKQDKNYVLYSVYLCRKSEPIRIVGSVIVLNCIKGTGSALFSMNVQKESLAVEFFLNFKCTSYNPINRLETIKTNNIIRESG